MQKCAQLIFQCDDKFNIEIYKLKMMEINNVLFANKFSRIA